jgi:hypothetical protein
LEAKKTKKRQKFEKTPFRSVVPINLPSSAIVYQALYGDRKFWVRPEKMFFGQIERNGKRCSRFQEIDWEE